MAKKRVARLNEQMKRELILLLRGEVRDPRVVDVTITDVEVSPDLYHAKVFVSVPGEPDDRTNALEGMRAAAGYLRGEIGRRMHIRRAPELHFHVDDTLQHAMHIERLLQEARASSAASAAHDDESIAQDSGEAAGDADDQTAGEPGTEHDER